MCFGDPQKRGSRLVFRNFNINQKFQKKIEKHGPGRVRSFLGPSAKSSNSLPSRGVCFSIKLKNNRKIAITTGLRIRAAKPGTLKDATTTGLHFFAARKCRPGPSSPPSLPDPTPPHVKDYPGLGDPNTLKREGLRNLLPGE